MFFALLLKSKLFQLVSLSCSIVVALFFIYQVGVAHGISEQKETYQHDYEVLLEKKLEEQKTQQEQANKEAIDFVIAHQKANVVYRDKVKIVEKIIKEKATVEACETITDDGFKDYLKELKAMK